MAAGGVRLMGVDLRRNIRPVAAMAPAPLGGCTRDTPRCADARSYSADLRACCRGHVRQIVADTVANLETFGIMYWADYGTLLGAVRNPLTTWADYHWLSQPDRPEGPLAPGIIPHDKDADFGFFGTDWQKLMRVGSALERMGYNVLVRPHGGSMKVRLSAVNHTNLDLFTWRQRSDGVFHRVRYISVDAFKGRDIPKGMLLPLSRVEWEGMPLSAPTSPAAFCAFRYGPNWMTPIPANHDGIRRG